MLKLFYGVPSAFFDRLDPASGCFFLLINVTDALFHGYYCFFTRSNTTARAQQHGNPTKGRGRRDREKAAAASAVPGFHASVVSTPADFPQAIKSIFLAADP